MKARMKVKSKDEGGRMRDEKIPTATINTIIFIYG
jgi:hypothetical protein